MNSSYVALLPYGGVATSWKNQDRGRPTRVCKRAALQEVCLPPFLLSPSALSQVRARRATVRGEGTKGTMSSDRGTLRKLWLAKFVQTWRSWSSSQAKASISSRTTPGPTWRFLAVLIAHHFLITFIWRRGGIFNTVLLKMNTGLTGRAMQLEQYSEASTLRHSGMI